MHTNITNSAAGGLPRPKSKVLCLYGIGTNSDILECQTAALRHQLGDDFEYDFVEGSYPWPAATGICDVYGDHQPCYSYLDGTAQGAVAAVDDLAAYVREHGPFDVALGFSLGAALIATLLPRPESGPGAVAIRSAVFLSGTLPGDWHALQKGTMRYLEAKDRPGPIRIPTVHAWSPKDAQHAGHSESLLHMCEPATHISVLHGAGHAIPSGDSDVGAIAEAIRRTIARLNEAE
ncbi:hypothetical protein CDD83_9905 [Cordyceps sp. RAO-2017]|nr:hypothetical protein CDD83_9905 [Cordyceps sp. RAO-2017]